MNAELLFSNYDWFEFESSLLTKLRDEIQSYDGNMFLNTPTDDLVAYFYDRFCLEFPVLIKDGIEADQKDVKINIQHDQRRHVYDRTVPTFVDGTQIEISIQFTGNKELFYLRPTQFSSSPPRAIIKNGELVFQFSAVELRAEIVEKSFKTVLDEIEWYLKNLKVNIDALNEKFHTDSRSHIETRKVKLLKDRNTVAALGFPLKKRDGAVATYAIPQLRRKLHREKPKASIEPYQPEPALSQGDYQEVLDIISNMASVIELSPMSFRTLKEEDIRTQFLLHLNGRFEGNATGETFNQAGKTDILIKDNGKNVFIAECKFWAGPKMLLSTIDQLLSYASWRDTKTAIIIFNKNKDFTSVINSIDETVRKHNNFKKFVARTSETNFQYIFTQKDDRDRELFLTVLAFNIPLPSDDVELP